MTIAGLGLIGGSIGKALRARGWHVSYVDPAVSIDEARASGAADERLDEVRGDFVVIATPVDAAIALIPAISASCVTSVCSVMAPLRAAARDGNFVAGHPFSGSERSGLGAADGELFKDRPWFIDRDDEQVRTLIRDCGGEAIVIDGAEHDRVLAMTSHLPQIISTALASLIAEVDPKLIGPGARSMLRLAGSSHDVWRPVLEANREHVDRAARELIAIISTLNEADFERARGVWATIRSEAKDGQS